MTYSRPSNNSNTIPGQESREPQQRPVENYQRFSPYDANIPYIEPSVYDSQNSSASYSKQETASALSTTKSTTSSTSTSSTQSTQSIHSSHAPSTVVNPRREPSVTISTPNYVKFKPKNVHSSPKNAPQPTADWDSIVFDWNSWQTKKKKRKFASQCIRLGIPDHYRPHMWQLLARSPILYDKSIEFSYQIFLNQAHRTNRHRPSLDLRPEDVIEFSAARAQFVSTSPQDLTKIVEPNNGITIQATHDAQKALENVVEAFAVFNSSFQNADTTNISYVAGILLFYMSEEQTFWMLNQLCQNYFLLDLFVKPEATAQSYSAKLSLLLHKFFPSLYSHLQKNRVPFESIVSYWFSTMFCCSVPFDLTLRIWDIFFSEGIIIIFRVSLAILQILEEPILSCTTPRQILYLLGQIPPKYLEPDFVFQHCWKIPLKYSDLGSVCHKSLRDK